MSAENSGEKDTINSPFLLGMNQEQRGVFETLVQERDELLRKNENLKRSLRFAGEVQKRTTPDSGPELEGYDNGALFVPARDVGGDSFDFYLPRSSQGDLGTDYLGVSVADAVDKDLSAEILASMTHALFHAEAFRYNATPTEVVKRVNRNLMLSAKNEGMFVTALYGILEPTTGKFIFVSQGHPVPILFGKDKEVLSVPNSIGRPLNVDYDIAAREEEIVIPEGGKMFLYTDGILEAENKNGSPYNKEQFYAVVRNNWNAPTQDVVERVMYDVCAYQGNPEKSSDDRTLIGFGRNKKISEELLSRQEQR